VISVAYPKGTKMKYKISTKRYFMPSPPVDTDGIIFLHPCQRARLHEPKND